MRSVSSNIAPMEETTHSQVHRAPICPQTSYLEQLLCEQTAVAVYLLNGMRLNGLIIAFDSFTVLLADPAGRPPCQLYKHAISVVSPMRSRA
jgi:host factor-I protein